MHSKFVPYCAAPENRIPYSTLTIHTALHKSAYSPITYMTPIDIGHLLSSVMISYRENTLALCW